MFRRALLVSCAIACGGKAEPQAPGEPMRTRVPRVDSAAVTIAPPASAQVPVLVFVQDNGRVSVGAGPSTWASLASFEPGAKAVFVDLEMAALRIREGVALGQSPQVIVDDLKTAATEEIDVVLREALGDERRALDQDDPPPPPPEDEPDEDEDTSPRAEGEYRMRKHAADPVLARDRERARALPGPRGRVRREPRADEAARVSSIAGAIEDPTFAMLPQYAAVAARPSAKATAVIDALVHTEGALLVTHAGDVRPLRLLFGPHTHESVASPAAWLEVRVTPSKIELEAVPDVPVSIAQIGELGKAFTTLRASHPTATATDVLVSADVDTQRLVDVLAVLDAAGARAIELGRIPAAGSAQARLRGVRIPRVTIGAAGELAPTLRASESKLLACRAVQPDLAGTLTIQLVVDPKGKVQRLVANGVAGAVADCITGVIKGLGFPPTKESTQATFPITLN